MWMWDCGQLTCLSSWTMAHCMLFYMKWLLLFLHLFLVSGDISDLRLCANPSCDEPVSHAKTLIKYIGSDKFSLTFGPNAEVVIYSKSAGSVPHLWGGAINGKRGYFPSKFVREYKVLTSHLPYTVLTEKGQIAEKQQELNDSNKELQPKGITSSLPYSDIHQKTANINDEKANGGEHVKLDELPNSHNISENEITQDLGSNSVSKSADSDLVPNKATRDQKSTIEPVKPTKSVSEAEIPDAKIYSGNGQVVETSSDVLHTSPSEENHLSLTPSASSVSLSLTNIVAHTKDFLKSEDAGFQNSAVWFPEKKAPSRSFFGHGVSADSSVDDKLGDPDGKFSPELQSWTEMTASTGNAKYIMVEGTQIPVQEDDEPITPGLSTSFSTTATESMVSPPKSQLPDANVGNSETGGLAASAGNAKSDSSAPSAPAVVPVESTLLADPVLMQPSNLPSKLDEISATGTLADQTNVAASPIIGDTDVAKSIEELDQRRTEIGGGGETPDVSKERKETEKGSGGDTRATSEVPLDQAKNNEKDGQTVEEQQGSVGWFDAVKNFVTLDEGVDVQIPPNNDNKKDSEPDLLEKSQAEHPQGGQINDKEQDIVGESVTIDDLEDDEDDDLEDDDPDDGAEEDEEDQDHDATEFGQDADLKEKSYHDRLVEMDEKQEKSGQSLSNHATDPSNENTKSGEILTELDQAKERHQGEVSGIENTRISSQDDEALSVNHADILAAEENAVNGTVIENNGADGGSTLELLRTNSDETSKPLELPKPVALDDESVLKILEAADNPTFEVGENETFSGEVESVIGKVEAVTYKDETVTDNHDESFAEYDKSSVSKQDLITNPSVKEDQDGFRSEEVVEHEYTPANVSDSEDAADFNISEDVSSEKNGENREFLQTSEVAEAADLSDDETVSATTEPSSGIDEDLNTPLTDDVTTTVSANSHFGESAFFERFTGNVNAEDNLGTCEGPGIDGACRAPDQVVASETESSEQQSFGDVASLYVSLIRSYMQAIINLLPESVKIVLYDLETSAVSPRVVIFVIIVGSFFCLLEISFIAIKTRCKEASLIGKISSLDQKLFTITKERDLLKGNVETYVDQNLEGEYQNAMSTIQALQSKLKMSQNECGKLQGTVSSLEEQLETATDAGLELNQLLSEFLTSQSDSGKLQNAVLQLQEQLNDQQKQFGEMQLSTEATRRENAELKEELETFRTNYSLIGQKYDELNQELANVNSMKEDLLQLISSKDEEINQLKESNNQLLKEAEVWDESVKQLQININEDKKNIQDLQDAMTFKDNKIEALKNCLLEIKISQAKADGDIVDDSDEPSPTSNKEDVLERLMDVSSMRAELKSVVDERDSILVKLEIQQNARLKAEEQVKKCLQEVEQVQAEYDKAHLEREAAQTKLNVLSNYFKEKELQLQKELGVQEAQRQQSQESVISVTQRIAMYEQETSLYKSQISSLKAEIESQERSYKNQMTAHEKKAHENWLAARSAERKLEESKQEAATLRNRLTLLEQEKANLTFNQSDTAKASIPVYPDNNGEVPSPPRLGPGDRSDSMDLPTSSRSSIFSREPLEILHGLPFLPPDRPLPPPFLRGLPPGGMLPPPPLLPLMDDRLPLPQFDPRRGMFPMHPPPGPLPGGPPPEHWMGPRRRGSPPFDHPSLRERPSPPLLSQRSPPPFDRRPSSSRNVASPQEPDPRDMGAPYDRDYRDRTPPARFFEPPMRPGFGGHPPLLMRGPPNPRPPMRRDVYPPGRADGSVDPRTSSPMTPKQGGNGTAT